MAVMPKISAAPSTTMVVEPTRRELGDGDFKHEFCAKADARDLNSGPGCQAVRTATPSRIASTSASR